METKLVKLGDIISLNYGKSLTKKNRIPGDVPVYGSSGITDYHDKPLVDAPSLIIGRKGSIGSVFLSEVPFYPIDTTYFAKESDLNGLDLHFAYYFLKFLPLSEMNTDSAIPGLNRNNFYSLDVVIPDIKSQKIIAFLLDQISYKIKINQQINKNLLRLCRIQFNRVKLACSSTTDLSNIAVLMMGQSPKGNTYNQKGEGTPLLNGAADFRGGINPSKYTSDPKKVTKPGDYVFGVRATIGLTTKVFGRYAIGRGTGLARSLKPESDELLYFILEDSFDYFSHAATGSVYPNVSRKDFEAYSSPAFSDNSQRVFHSFAAPLMEKIYQDETQNKKLTQIRDILLPKLLSGSVDLSGIEEAMKNA